MHLNRVKKLKIPEGAWKCPPHCLGLQRLNVLRITTKQPLIDLLCFWLFLSFDAEAIFAKISSSNHLLTMDENLTRGNKDIQYTMYIQYVSLQWCHRKIMFFLKTQEYHTIKTPNTVSVQLLLASLLIIFYQGYDNLEGLYAFIFTCLSCP